MKDKKITLDTVVRGIIAIAIVVGIIMLLNRLSGVLLPFFAAWLLAYMLFPLVKFFQYKCRLKFRIAGIFFALLTVGLVLTGISWLVIPPMIDEGGRIKDVIITYIEGNSTLNSIPGMIQDFIRQHTDVDELKSIVTQQGFIDNVKIAMPKVWGVIAQSVSVLSSLLSLTMIFLYMVFINHECRFLIIGDCNQIIRCFRNRLLRSGFTSRRFVCFISFCSCLPGVCCNG